MHTHYEVIIIGAGAAGLMCALKAAKPYNPSVLVIEHTGAVGEKIRISGGGRCNFTNSYASPRHYLSENPHFCTSALARYTPSHFLEMIQAHGIAYYEKKLGQLFCQESSKQIIAMLVKECTDRQVSIYTNCTVQEISKADHFQVVTSQGRFSCNALVIATGGLSIPKLGASSFGYDIARQFGLSIIPPKPALVPLTLEASPLKELSGVSVDTIVTYKNSAFRENTLFTHRGLSGPAILQISSYLEEKEAAITLNLFPEIDIFEVLKAAKQTKVTLQTVLNRYLSKRLTALWCEKIGGYNANMLLADMKDTELASMAHHLTHWKITPTGNEGYEKAEVTRGGIDTRVLSSKTMESKQVKGLFFIGEVVDVTGWLGGYNFQWAWASGAAAGQYLHELS